MYAYTGQLNGQIHPCLTGLERFHSRDNQDSLAIRRKHTLMETLLTVQRWTLPKDSVSILRFQENPLLPPIAMTWRWIDNKLRRKMYFYLIHDHWDNILVADTWKERPKPCDSRVSLLQWISISLQQPVSCMQPNKHLISLWRLSILQMLCA